MQRFMGTHLLYFPMQVMDTFNYAEPGSAARSLFRSEPAYTALTWTVEPPVAVQRCPLAVQIAS